MAQSFLRLRLSKNLGALSGAPERGRHAPKQGHQKRSYPQNSTRMNTNVVLHAHPCQEPGSCCVSRGANLAYSLGLQVCK